MKRHFVTHFFALTLLSALACAQIPSNCASNESYSQTQGQNSVTVPFTQQTPGSGLLLWVSQFTYGNPSVTFTDDNPGGQLSYAPPMLDPAHVIGLGAVSYVEGANFQGTEITANTSNPNEAVSLIVCELPNTALSNMLAVYTTSVVDNANSIESGSLHMFQAGPGNYLLVYCVEAGASFMQPFVAGEGFSIPANATEPNGACSFELYSYSEPMSRVRSLDLSNPGLTTNMQWDDSSLHISSFFAAFRLAE
jgi:hypothetical protein